MRRRPAIVTSAAGAVLLLAACGGGEPSATEQRADQVAEAARDAGLADDVAELLGDAARGVDGTYRVTYEVADAAGGPPQRVTVTQRPPDRRLDIERADGTADATIAVGDTSHQCTRDDSGWRCELLAEDASPGGGLFDATAIDALVASLTDGAAAYEFAVERRELVGVEASCLVTRRRTGAGDAGAPDDPALGAEGTLCLSAEGARLLTEVPSGTLRAVDYTTEVADDAFALPVPPSD